MKRLADLVRPPGGPVAAARRLIRRRGVRGAARHLGPAERAPLLVATGTQAPRLAHAAILRHLLVEMERRRP